jgi:hypothetical protein
MTFQPPRPPPPPPTTTDDNDDDEVEVITMHRLSATPSHHRTTRKSLVLGPFNMSSPQIHLSPVHETPDPDVVPRPSRGGAAPHPTSAGADTRKHRADSARGGTVPAWGQGVNSFDLIANNIENALHGMR